jgi:NitT/TauT family transport system substrate-binding protein
MSYATESSASAPMWIAKELGLFDKYGIEVPELTYIRGGATNMQAVIAGSVDVSLGGSTALVTANLGGADARFIATTSVVSVQAIVAKPSITAPDQLRGKTVAVGVTGGSSLPQFAQALRIMGLTLEEVHVLDFPLSNDRLAALVNGSVDAIVVPQAVREQAAELGYPVLLDLRKVGVPTQGESLVAMQAYIEQNHDLVKDVLKAFCEAIYLELTDKPTAERVIAKWAGIQDPRVVEATYRSSADVLQRKPYPSLPGIQSLLDGLPMQNPDVKDISLDRLVSDAILRELDSEGFLDALWSRE